MAKGLKVAIVHDWLTNMGGAERVVLALHKAFPDAPIFTSVFDAKSCPEFAKLDVRTTYLQKIPKKLRNRHQLLPLLRANAFRKLDLSEFDIAISSASAEAKAVRALKPGAVHICYCHTPTRYYWSHYKEYLNEPGFGRLDPIVKVALPVLVKIMRRADLRAVRGVDYFIANSSAVADRIKKYYHCDSTIINPPVSLARFTSLNINGERSGYIALGRQVAYKRFDLAIEACNKLKLPLTLYGNGPEHAYLQQIAGPTIKFVTGASDKEIALALTHAEALLFPQLEDFGIVQLEAMAAGCPVIAYGAGGALDTIKEGKNGVLFAEQTAKCLAGAIEKAGEISFAPKTVQKTALSFGENDFIDRIRAFVKAVRE